MSAKSILIKTHHFSYQFLDLINISLRHDWAKIVGHAQNPYKNTNNLQPETLLRTSEVSK